MKAEKALCVKMLVQTQKGHAIDCLLWNVITLKLGHEAIWRVCALKKEVKGDRNNFRVINCVYLQNILNVCYAWCYASIQCLVIFWIIYLAIKKIHNMTRHFVNMFVNTSGFNSVLIAKTIMQFPQDHPWYFLISICFFFLSTEDILVYILLRPYISVLLIKNNIWEIVSMIESISAVKQ